MVQYDPQPQPVREIFNLYEQGLLNLEPVFQRNGVWSRGQRIGLLESIFQGYPIPSVFLYRRKEEDTGRTVFEVIDGKQRIETLLMYANVLRGERFAAPLQLPAWEHPQPVDWRQLCRLKEQARLEE